MFSNSRPGPPTARAFSSLLLQYIPTGSSPPLPLFLSPTAFHLLQQQAINLLSLLSEMFLPSTRIQLFFFFFSPKSRAVLKINYAFGRGGGEEEEREEKKWVKRCGHHHYVRGGSGAPLSSKRYVKRENGNVWGAER